MESFDKIDHKFTKLINEGKEIIADAGWNGQRWVRFPSHIDYVRFRTECLNLIQKVCGEKSSHYKSLNHIAEDEKMGSNPSFFHMCYGILEAAYNDFKDDFLFDIRSLMSAELLGDFLSQAETLLEGGYYAPAASLAGAVLEDSLRKLSDKNGIIYSDKTTIDKLNVELAKAEIYSKAYQKEITAKADIRNNADHGHAEKFKSTDVEFMIKWIRQFESEYLIK